MSKWFYTEDEVNTLLNGKSDSNHNHDSRYYLKTEVDAIEDTLRLAIESLVGFTASIVESLPQTGSSGVMYLVPNDEGVEQDYYTEYIWTDEEKFEKIGNTAVEVDLSGYATISFVNSALADYVTSDELDGLLAGKADVVHTHSISDVSGLQSSLDGKAGNSVASSSSNGLMSSTDKTKLDGIASGANKTTVDSAMSSTSVNPVQNKVVKAELDSLNTTKANTNHTHNSLKVETISEGIDFNDYKTEGLYNLPWASVNQSTNRPSNTGGRLEVIVFSNGVRQFFYNYGSDNTGLKVYFRNFDGTNDVWMAWHSLADNNDITSLDNNKANTNHTHNNYTATTTVTCNYGTVKKFKKNGWAFVVYENINISPLSLEVWTEIADIGWSNQAGNEYTANFQTSVPEDRFRITEDGKLSAMKYGDSNHRGHYGYIVYPTAD